jgi:hypothetical protein
MPPTDRGGAPAAADGEADGTARAARADEERLKARSASARIGGGARCDCQGLHGNTALLAWLGSACNEPATQK